MAAPEVHLDFDAIGKIIRGPELRKVMTEAAHALAQELGARGVRQVWVNSYTTDRAAASVTIPGHDVDTEIRDGLLSNAAVAIGLEMKRAAS